MRLVFSANIMEQGCVKMPVGSDKSGGREQSARIKYLPKIIVRLKYSHQKQDNVKL